MKLMDIKNAITEKLRNSFKDHNIYVDEKGQSLVKPALVVQLYPISMAIENKYHRRKFINASVHFHSTNGTNDENLQIIDDLYEAFDPVLAVKDRIFNVGIIRTRIKDNILRVSFNLDFIDTIEETKSYNFEEYELMSELEMKEEF